MGPVRLLKRTRFPIFRHTKAVQFCSQMAETRQLKDLPNLDYDRAKPFSEIPGPKGPPYIGTLMHYKFGPYTANQYHNALLERYREYGKIVKETIAGHTVVHLFHPDYIKVMYGNDGKIPHIPPLLETQQIYRKQKNMSPGLGNINGEEWYRLRTNVNRMMLRPKAVTMFLPHVNQVANDFISYIKLNTDPQTGELRNFANDISKWILESSAMTCFEKRLGCFQAEQDSFQQRMIDSAEIIFTCSRKLKFGLPWYRVNPWLSPSWKKLVNAEDFIFKNAQKFVDETVAQIKELVNKQELDGNRYGFLTYLLGKKDLTYKDLSVIAISLFADGLNTTAPTMAGQLYCMATNQDKQDKLYNEICQLMPQTSATAPDVTAEVIKSASYIRACIKEGFRLFQIGTAVPRIPTKDIVVGGYHIPAGTHVELNNNMLLRLPEYFENPERYIPERWVRGGSAQNIHPYLLLPFSHGPRKCVGSRFAEQEMNVMMIKLLQNFRLEWAGETKMQQKYNILLRPDYPCRIRFIPR